MKINVLSREVSELIAAGEVIDRPASVLKELAENSIDAGATSVVAEIKNGGVTFMRVTDDGCGIDREDVPTALLSHATSKVITQDDLDHITTLGFRGEALASISAVSRLEIFTRTAENDIGVHLISDGGEDVRIDDAGCGKGTTMIVRDLFFNTPARQKFLKTDSVEGSACQSVIDNIALSHPEISFRFIKDGKEYLNTPGDGKLRSAVYSVFGRDFVKGLIPVDYTHDNVRVYGFVSKPGCARPNRRMQHFFINGRFVKCRTAMAAMEQAFKNSIMVGKFPACVLNIEINSSVVDVNVHPTKLEVRFANERPVFDTVYYGVKTALQQEDAPKEMELKRPPVESARPDEDRAQLKINDKISRDEPKRNPWADLMNIGRGVKPKDNNLVLRDSKPVFTRQDISVNSDKENTDNKSDIIKNGYSDISEKVRTEEKEPDIAVTEVPRFIEEPIDRPAKKEASKRIVGEVFKTYCIVEYDDDTLVFIDKHAAHERLLYEKLKAEDSGDYSQMLLEPVTVVLSKVDYSTVMEKKELFYRAGFEIDEFGDGTVIIRSAPSMLIGFDIASIFLEMAGYICSGKTDIMSEQLDWIYHNIACRAAVKAGSSLSQKEIESLVDTLEDNPDVRYCPHGRPCFVIMKKRELEKQFGRIQ